MTTLAVRFDQELSVAHAVDGDLPCPRGILVPVPNPWDQDGHNGVPRRVDPCKLHYGHLFGCSTLASTAARRNVATTTVCGLSLAELPFVPSPEGMTPCTGCFDGNEISYVEEVMFA